MELSITATLLAGISALILALGVLFRGPIRWRNRSFAWLSLALAVWHLGYAGALLSGSTRIWQPLYLLGSFAAVPLGLDFALTLRGVTWKTRRTWVLPISVCALALWGWSAGLATTAPHNSWPRVAFFSIVLLGALAVILRTAMERSPGPARRALLGVAVGGVLVTLGGVYDLVPQDQKIPGVGALATLLFLAVICAVVLKDRLLDIDGWLLRGVAILSLSSAAAVPLWFAARQFERLHFLPFLVVTLVVLTPIFLLAPRLRTRADSFLHSNDPLVKQINTLSRSLHESTSLDEVLQRLDATGRTLPPPITLQLSLEVHEELNSLFSEEPWVTRQWLVARIEDLGEPDKGIANQALQLLLDRNWNLVFPIRRSNAESGCLAIGGPVPDSYLSEAMASAVGALANQISASLERIEQLDAARRNASFIALGEVAAGLAHEIRNPLAALRGAGQAMDERSTAEQRQRMLAVIEEESSRLESFVQDFLEFAVPRPLSRQPVDLERLSRDAVAARRAAGESFEVRWELGADSSVVSGDPEPLRRAIDNLLRNASEQVESGLELTIGIASEGSNRLAWSVADNGPGIEEGLLHRVRTPYFTTKSSGSGLGLAMVGSVAERHGGTLRIQNRTSGGAVFTLVLPTGSA